MPNQSDLQKEVMPELVKMVFTSLGSVITVGVALIMTSATIAALHGDQVIAAFSIATAAILSARVAISLRFRQAAAAGIDADQASRWEKAYAAGGCAFAGLLGIFSAYAFWKGPAVGQLLTATVLLAYPTGMIVRVAVRPTIARAQLVLTLLPPALAALAIGGVEHWLMGVFFIAYLVSGLAMITHLHQTILSRVLAHREIARLAHHDELTGLPNRRHFDQRLAEAIARHDRYGHAFALIYLDLDRFKQVNDTRGHAAGDELLRQVADRLRSTARASDFIARLSGDEFAVIQTPIAGATDIEGLSARIVESLGRSFTIEGKAVEIGASVGAVIRGDENPDILRARADQALYAAKEAGRGQYRIAGLEMAA